MPTPQVEAAYARSGYRGFTPTWVLWAAIRWHAFDASIAAALW